MDHSDHHLPDHSLGVQDKSREMQHEGDGKTTYAINIDTEF